MNGRQEFFIEEIGAEPEPVAGPVGTRVRVEHPSDPRALVRGTL